MNETTSPIALRHTAIALAATATLLGGCSSIENFFSGDKVDYRTSATKTTAPLEVPPDLTQLAREGRFRPQGGVVSASAAASANAGAAAATGAAVAGAVAAPATVAPAALGAMKIERDGSQRWLTVPMSPEQLWPLLQAFWQERGFTLEIDNAPTGVMETNWAETRANIPQGAIRNALSKVFDSLYSSGERDRYRTRLERTATGTEVYISHRGMQEIFVGTDRESKTTVWQSRPSDPQLEAEFLSRLMVKLGASTDVAKAAANPAEPAPRARPAAPGAGAVAGASMATAAASTATSLELDDAFDRAWRRVGLALDRTGFTVEDRDRAAGLYFVRYVNPDSAGKEEPNFFARIFGIDNKVSAVPVRYRVLVKGAAGAKTVVSVQDTSGAADTSENARRIIGLLMNELK